jgi:hypothetical protein
VILAGSLLVHRYDDRIAAKTEHQAGAFGLQVHDDALLILQPKIAAARIADSEAIAGLAVCAGEVLQAVEFVDLSLGADRRGADAANAQAADRKGVGSATLKQCPAAATGAANKGGLNLLHVHGTVRSQSGNGFRTELDGRRTTGQQQQRAQRSRKHELSAWRLLVWSCRFRCSVDGRRIDHTGSLHEHCPTSSGGFAGAGLRFV